MPEKLTARKIESAPVPGKGTVDLLDSEVPGLTFRVSSHGLRNWSLRLKVDGKFKRFSLGEYPAVMLKQAREEARGLKSRVRRGEDPRVEEKARKAAQAAEMARSEAGTVGKVLAQYWDLHLSEKAEAETWRRALERALAKHMNKPMESLSTLDLDTAVSIIRKEGKPSMANRVRSHLRTFTRWAFDKGICPYDAGKGMAKKTEELGRDLVLELDELASIWQATIGPGGQRGSADQRAPGQGQVWGPFIRFLMLTGQRFGDVSGMRWEHLNGSTWSQPAKGTKNRKPHIVHLTEAALDVLNSQVHSTGVRNGLVFHTDSGAKLTSSGRRLRRLREEADVSSFTLHDFRTALASHLAGRGHPEGVVDRITDWSKSQEPCRTNV